MNTHPYYGPGSIVIDSCGNCGLVWLDGGELETVINAPGKGRGE
jgi:Zn-finger nucleic acid-binding protein